MHKWIIILGLLLVFVMVCLGTNTENFTSESETKFLDIQKTINPNIQFNMTEIDKQVSQQDMDDFIKNGYWSWSAETQRLYKEALSTNPYVKSEDHDKAMKKAQTIYNEQIILQILSSQTPEGRFLLNGMDIMGEIPDSGFGNYPYEAGMKEQEPEATVRCYQADENGKYSLADKDKKTIDYNQLESLVPGFKFINGACDPCDALNQNYNCPFKVTDKTSDIWSQIWGLSEATTSEMTEYPLLTGLKYELDDLMKN
jgi:hypothetical protein